jgi:hypothetical protein
VNIRTSSQQNHPVNTHHIHHTPYPVSNYPTDQEVPFVHPDDLALYNAWDSRSFEVQVANHELLGHGTGKLFTEDAEGKLNFDPEKARTYNCGTLLFAMWRLRLFSDRAYR